MYVCLCNGYRNTELRALAETGVRCARMAYLTLGGALRCGRCLATAQELTDRVHVGLKSEITFAAPLARQAD